MLSAEQNDRITQVGPGTPGGEMMRRYWHPIAPAAKLDEDPVQPVRILGEDLTLYRDHRDRLGLVGQRCPHRAFDLRFGIPEEEGLRCPYHGWMFDGSGACVQQPLEPPDSTYKDRVSIKAYPVQELGGLVWAYLGPLPAPLLPHDDLLVREDGFRQIFLHSLPCNWLQVMENRADPSHATYLHGRQTEYLMEKASRTDWHSHMGTGGSMMSPQVNMLARGAYPINNFIPNPYGYCKSKRDSDVPAEELGEYWEIGSNPALFPYQLAFTEIDGNGHPVIRRGYQYGVPIDDAHTVHVYYICYLFPPEVHAPKQASVPYKEIPLKDENGEYILDYVISQDMVGWYAQGDITDRTEEHLGLSDTILIEFRKLLEEQIKIVEGGGEPINVYWEQEDAYRRDLNLPQIQALDTNRPEQSRIPGRSKQYNLWPERIKGDLDKFGAPLDILTDLYERTAELWGLEPRSIPASK